MMVGQLRALLWLKSRLLLHGLRKTTGILSAGLTVLVVSAVAVAAVGLSAGLFALGAFVELERGGALPILAVADGFVFFFCIFWVASVLAEVQRSDVVDMRKMLYLPVSLRSIFAINFAFSLFTPAGVLFVLPGLAFVAGLTVRHGSTLLLGLLPVLAFYLALSGWTYFFRGWLAAVMENKRHRRILLMIVPMFFFLLAWAPQFLFRLGPRWMPGDPETVLIASNMLLPPGWLPLALQNLVLGETLMVLACTAGLTGLGILPLSMGYRATRRYYLGIQTRRQRKPRAAIRQTGREAVERAFVAKTIPGCSEETSAVALASIKMLSRHPVMRMQLVAPLLVGLFLLALFAIKSGGSLRIPAIARNALPTAALAWPLLNSVMFFVNIFGTDGDGFRSFMLLPAPRRTCLLGRNMAIGALLGSQMAVFAVLAFLIVRPQPMALPIALVNAGWVFLFVTCVGNVCSLYLPFKVSPDSMRGAASKSMSLLTVFAFLFLLPLIMLPPMLCAMLDPMLALVYPGWFLPGGLALAVLFLVVAAAGYWCMLDVFGGILEARESKILEAITKGKE